MNKPEFSNRSIGRNQSGIVTVFTAVMILVLLTLMVFFGMRVGVFEQRVSANEVRQKAAFHVAESGIHFAKEFLRANLAMITSDREIDPNDYGPSEVPPPSGWLSAKGHWRTCSSVPKPRMFWATTFATAGHHCEFSSRPQVSKTYVENVVNAPMKPTRITVRTSPLIVHRCSNDDQHTPNRRQPSTFTVTVPQGKSLPATLCTSPDKP